MGHKGDKVRESTDNCMYSLADVIEVIKVVEGAARMGKLELHSKFEK